ncbi:hypothetical protein [Kocuria sp.]|uniref:hypothetical protein n=1 Tax=Kocuria sp. TaxID=1871328 RepID=UPI0026DEFC3E|nr:hypothetical protein [Kocuria sp.]MDO5619257.1 hypothetical protein [Kocuria sp.]
MRQVLYHGGRPALYAKKAGRVVWPNRTQDLANEQVGQVQQDPIFTAEIQTKGFRNYAERNPSSIVADLDYGIGQSPAGDGETVLWFDNSRHLTNGNAYQRSQVQTTPCIAPVAHSDQIWGNANSVYVEYARVWLDSAFPWQSAGDWINFFEPHGGPYVTSSAMGLMVVLNPSDGKTYLRMGNDPTYLGWNAPFPLGQWVQIVRQYRYEYAADGGWGDLWVSYGSDPARGWNRIPILGGHRHPLDVVRRDAQGNRTEGGGWVDSPRQAGGQWAMTHSKVGLYGNVYTVMYVGDHRVGRTFTKTMPAGWSIAAFDGFDPDNI